MASVTIKRSHDWDPLNSSPNGGCGGSSKRFRCSTMSSPISKDPTSFGYKSSVNSDDIRDEMKRLGSRSSSNCGSCLPLSQPLALNLAHAYFGLSPEKTSPSSSPSHNSSSNNNSNNNNLLAMASASCSVSGPLSPGGSSSSSRNVSIEDQPMLSLKQVAMICKKLLAKQEQELRQEYDKILNQKMAEQYDTFVNFTYEQIQRRFESDPTPSYLS